MTSTATQVSDRVNDVLARHFPDGEFIVTSHTGGTAAIVIAPKCRELLQQGAATLREAGLIVADYSRERGAQLYVYEHGPSHDAATARGLAALCARGYDEHVRQHGSAGEAPAGAVAGVRGGGIFTVERHGRLYNVTVTPRT